MKKTWVIFLTFLVMLTTSKMQAAIWDDCCGDDYCYITDPRFYARVFGGANYLQTSKNNDVKADYNTGYILSGALGYNWCYGLRAEVEYAYRRNTLRKVHFFGRSFDLNGHFQSSSYMANLLWDISLGSWGCGWGLKPYIGAGIGYDTLRSRGEQDGFSFNENKKNGFAWQLIAGLGYEIFCNTDLSVEYRFHKGPIHNLYSHSIGLGLKYNFGCGWF